MSNLGPQFYQPPLPGMPEPRQALPVLPPTHQEPVYTDARHHVVNRDEWVPNPIPATPPGAYKSLSAARKGAEVDEWVPLEHVYSTQPEVHAPSVKHQVDHADPLRLDEDPRFASAPHNGRDIYSVRDGNHRVAAALQRGQLIMPGRVAREP